MTRSTTRPDSAPGTRTSGLLTALRATAVLSTLNVLYQGATAGQVLMKGDAALEWHGGGAIALHVLTGLMTVAAVLWARAEGGPWWPAALSAVVFVATFVEAYLGEGSTLYIHVRHGLGDGVGVHRVHAHRICAHRICAHGLDGPLTALVSAA